MSSRNDADGTNNGARELDSSDEETQITASRALSRIRNLQASVASMPGTSGESHPESHQLPIIRCNRFERDRLFWTLMSASRQSQNARYRWRRAFARGPPQHGPPPCEPPQHGPPPRGPRLTTYVDLLEANDRIPLTPQASPPGGSYQPNASELASVQRSAYTMLHRRLRNRLRVASTGTGNVTGPGSRPLLVLHATPEASRGEGESDIGDYFDRDRSDRDRGDFDRGELDRSTREHERHHDPEPIDLDSIEDVSVYMPPRGVGEMGQAPVFTPPRGVGEVFIPDAEEPLNMSTGSLMEEEILEVEPDPEPQARPAGDNERETAGTSSESNQQRENNRKREGRDEETLDPVLALNRSILRLLECPVCFDWMETPITQCRRGHLVCGECRNRLEACPVCRTPFSSVRNRAMEDVAGVLRYPCRHGCGRLLRATRRHQHEASCAARRHACPLPACRSAPPMSRARLQAHAQTRHPEVFKTGTRHVIPLYVRTEQHVQLVVAALGALFHVRVDMDVRTWGVCALVQYLGPQDQAHRYTYEVTVIGRDRPSNRRLVYRRATHSDLENPAINTNRQDCFHLTLDQALNYLRYRNEMAETGRTLDLIVTLAEAESPSPSPSAGDD